MNNDRLFYNQFYRQLDRCTPLRSDCGRLCNRACCRGPAEARERDAGMWLFPGEELLLADETSFQIRPLQLKSAMRISKEYPPDIPRQLACGRPLYWMTCAGHCDRAKRPLACRIFPLTPYLTKKDLMIVTPDPRARHLCPLAAQELQEVPLIKNRPSLQPEFRQRVGQVCRELAREPEIKEFLAIWTAEIDEYRRLLAVFGQEE